VRSPREIIFRLRQEAGNLARFAVPPHARSAIQPPLTGLPHPAAVARRLAGTPYAIEVERLADGILQHRFCLMGYAIETGPVIDWRRDYVSGKSTGPDYFRLVPYLDCARAGDHKPIWELNRNQHLVLLAQAWRLTGRAEYCREIEVQLQSWWAANPYARGINWASALEVAFRALSWIWVYHIAGAQLGQPVRARLLDSLYAHGRHLEGNLSVYFSPNTHLLGEAVALHAIGTLFPDYPRAKRWRREGGAMVRAQMDAQVRADGSHFEQSTYYHVYALDMLKFSALLEAMPPDYRAKLRRMEEYLDALLGPQRRLAFFGDDDGGRFFHPYGPRDRFGLASLALAGRGEPTDYPEIGAWWIGGEFTADAAPVRADSQWFENAGLAIMQNEDTQLIADAGPMGAGGAGHSHADALSFTLNQGQQNLLIDAGTFTYVGDAKWRDWFRGTAAHNTIRIGGLDQATPTGPFRWAGKPEVAINLWRTDPHQDFLDAACRYRGFEHRRKILWVKPSLILILDTVIHAAAPPPVLEQFWHSGEEAIQESARSFRLGKTARLLLSHDADLEFGGENGWRSRVFGGNEPAFVITVTQRGSLPAQFAAVIDLSGETQSFELSENGATVSFLVNGASFTL
jgi:hypothetical protein